MVRLAAGRFILGVLGTAAFLLIGAHDTYAYTFKVLHDFCSVRLCNDGANPQSSLIIDGNGTLYGTTTGGGGEPDGGGVVFALVPGGQHGGWTSKALHIFPYETEPRGNLIMDTAGDLYGSTQDGIYELLPNGTRWNRILKTLYTFPSPGTNGYFPAAGLTYQGAASGLLYDGSSPLFGTTLEGGINNFYGGVVFELTPKGTTWTEIPLYSFCAQAQCADGQEPFAGLLMDASGNLYGVSRFGGAHDDGTAFELAENSGGWSETVLHDFCARKNCADGGSSDAAFISDGAGNLYAAGSGGEAKRGCCGTVFQITPNGSQSPYSVIYNFCSEGNCRDGADPYYSTLIRDSAGTFYGTTQSGGHGLYDEHHEGGGTIFALRGTSLQVLYQFCRKSGCEDGEYPMAGLVMDSAGDLFGTTSQGGKYGAGVVFELTP